MEKIDIETGEVTTIETPETTEQKELSNREKQFQRLLEASVAARAIKEDFINNAKSEDQALYYECLPLNHYILNYVYKTEEITDYKKFPEWKSKGATVLKGSKAFPIWGQPVGAQKQEKAEQKGEQYDPTAEEERRFPMCYVFSNLQVSFKNQSQTIPA